MDDGVVFSARQTLERTSGNICMDNGNGQYTLERLVGLLILLWNQCAGASTSAAIYSTSGSSTRHAR